MKKKWYLVGDNERYGNYIICDYPKNVKLTYFGGKYLSISLAGNSKEDLKKICNIVNWVCFKCNNVVSLCYTNKKDLIKNKLCISCNFWFTIINNSKNRVVIDNHCYYIYPENNGPNSCKGFGGTLFKIKFFESNKVIETTNLWHNGEIPELFRNDLPNNAQFLKKGG